MTAPSTAVTAPRTRSANSDHAVLWSGVVLGVVLALALGGVIANDHTSRLAAARQQAAALAKGTERLVWLELRNLERAMLGIADDASRFSAMSDQDIAAPVAQMIKGVVDRQPELADLVLLDRQGRPLTTGRNRRSAAGSIVPTHPTSTRRMTMGAPVASCKVLA